jgi:hypothetical protein
LKIVFLTTTILVGSIFGLQFPNNILKNTKQKTETVSSISKDWVIFNAFPISFGYPGILNFSLFELTKSIYISKHLRRLGIGSSLFEYSECVLSKDTTTGRYPKIFWFRETLVSEGGMQRVLSNSLGKGTNWWSYSLNPRYRFRSNSYTLP